MGEVSPAPFTHHLPPSAVPELLPWAAASPSIGLASPFQGQAAWRNRAGLGSPRDPGRTVSPPSQSCSRRRQPHQSAEGCSGNSDDPPPRFSSGCPKLPAHPRNPPASLGAKKELKGSKKRGKTFPGQSQGVWSKLEPERGLIPASPTGDRDGIPTASSALPQTFIAGDVWGPPPALASQGSPISPCHPTQLQQPPKPQPCPTEELTWGNRDSPPSPASGN